MPTHNNLGALPSVSATKNESRSGMLAPEVLAVEKKSLSAMLAHTDAEMSKSEALAVAWTGIEALAVMGQAKVYRSQRTGRVWVELLATDVTHKDGLKPLENQSVGNK